MPEAACEGCLRQGVSGCWMPEAACEGCLKQGVSGCWMPEAACEGCLKQGVSGCWMPEGACEGCLRQLLYWREPLYTRCVWVSLEVGDSLECVGNGLVWTEINNPDNPAIVFVLLLQEVR